MSLKKWWQQLPFKRLLKRAKKEGKRRFLICWNRGLGDIPLGLYALTWRIRQEIPEAEVTYLTREDLREGFSLLQGVSTLIDPTWKRGIPFDLDASLSRLGLERASFDLILERPDPTRWLSWQLGKLTPQLRWDPAKDAFSTRFSLDKEVGYIGVHVQTETSYQYEKNWPLEHWRAFFKRCYEEQGVRPLLFGFSKNPPFEEEGVIDLRGETTLFEMLSLIKNHCSYLLVPDSGVLSILYYLDISFPIEIVSLWADPRQGILKQNVSSPNPLLNHCPLIAEQKDLRTVSVEEVMGTLFGKKEEEVRGHVEALGQVHLLEGWKLLKAAEKERFLAQLAKYTPDLLREQRALQKFSAPNSLQYISLERGPLERLFCGQKEGRRAARCKEKLPA